MKWRSKVRQGEMGWDGMGLGFFRRGAKSGASGRNVEGAPLVIFGSEPKIARLMIFLF